MVPGVAAEERHPALAEVSAVGDLEAENPAVEIRHPVELGHVYADMAHLEFGGIRHLGFLSLAPAVHGFFLTDRGAKDKGVGQFRGSGGGFGGRLGGEEKIP